MALFCSAHYCTVLFFLVMLTYMIRHANLFYYVPFLLYSVPLMRRYLLTSQFYTYHFLCLSHPISLPLTHLISLSLTHFRLIAIGLSSTVKWKNIKRLYRIIRRSVYSYILFILHNRYLSTSCVILLPAYYLPFRFLPFLLFCFPSYPFLLSSATMIRTCFLSLFSLLVSSLPLLPAPSLLLLSFTCTVGHNVGSA